MHRKPHFDSTSESTIIHPWVPKVGNSPCLAAVSRHRVARRISPLWGGDPPPPRRHLTLFFFLTRGGRRLGAPFPLVVMTCASKLKKEATICIFRDSLPSKPSRNSWDWMLGCVVEAARYFPRDGYAKTTAAEVSSQSRLPDSLVRVSLLVGRI